MPSSQGRSGGWWSSLKAFIIAPLIFLIVLGGIFAYSGVWPPMVVIESKSMQHADDSAIGVIDTGDIVVVKEVSSLGQVTTYLEGVATGHSTYGEPGDVVIYYKAGMSKPIIHRALVGVVYNSTGGGFDIPELAGVPASMWSVPGEEKRWWNLQDSVELYDIGYLGVTVVLDLKAMLDFMTSPTYSGQPHGGIITMGDNNWYTGTDGTLQGKYDQKWISAVREPIKEEWIIGKARGELPWFGLIKLYATGSAPDYTPKNSQVNLVIALVLIITVPVAVDMLVDRYRKRKGQRGKG
ncbi:MAG: S26 family signal peptidase [Methanomassiliicoccus sp.]|nr:S26 family signal peptidase [Methanomassiliicoccus sp.]